MNIGRVTQKLASGACASAVCRAAVRRALAPVLEEIRYELELVAEALDGQDPEYALSLFLDIVSEGDERLKALEAELAAARPLRLVA